MLNLSNQTFHSVSNIVPVRKKKEWFFYRFELASDRLECAQLPLNAIHQEARVELDGLSGVHQPTFPYQAEP